MTTYYTFLHIIHLFLLCFATSLLDRNRKSDNGKLLRVELPSFPPWQFQARLDRLRPHALPEEADADADTTTSLTIDTKRNKSHEHHAHHHTVDVDFPSPRITNVFNPREFLTCHHAFHHANDYLEEHCREVQCDFDTDANEYIGALLGSEMKKSMKRLYKSTFSPAVATDFDFRPHILSPMKRDNTEATIVSDRDKYYAAQQAKDDAERLEADEFNANSELTATLEQVTKTSASASSLSISPTCSPSTSPRSSSSSPFKNSIHLITTSSGKIVTKPIHSDQQQPQQQKKKSPTPPHIIADRMSRRSITPLFIHLALNLTNGNDSDAGNEDDVYDDDMKHEENGKVEESKHDNDMDSDEITGSTEAGNRNNNKAAENGATVKSVDVKDVPLGENKVIHQPGNHGNNGVDAIFAE
jgi:hypothetical protein